METFTAVIMLCTLIHPTSHPDASLTIGIPGVGVFENLSITVGPTKFVCRVIDRRETSPPMPLERRR